MLAKMSTISTCEIFIQDPAKLEVSLSGILTVLRQGCACVVLMCVSVVGIILSVVALKASTITCWSGRLTGKSVVSPGISIVLCLMCTRGGDLSVLCVLYCGVLWLVCTVLLPVILCTVLWIVSKYCTITPRSMYCTVVYIIV